jgi:hypothetical protein
MCDIRKYVNNEYAIFGTLFIVHWVRPEPAVPVFVVFAVPVRCPNARYHRLLTVERHPHPSAESHLSLKHGHDLPPFPDQLTDPRRTLCRDVAQLHTTAGVDRNRIIVGRVFGFGAKLDRLTGGAELDFETPAGSALVGVIGAYDGQREGSQCEDRSIRPRLALTLLLHGQP